MGPRLLGREIPRVDLLLHVRVILGELHQLLITVEVRAAVPYLSDEEPRLVQYEGGHRGSHAALVVLGQRPLEDGTVRAPDRRAHPVRDLVVRETFQRPELARHEAHRHLTRHLTGGVPPIPSATTKIPRSGTMRKLSSFPE